MATSLNSLSLATFANIGLFLIIVLTCTKVNNSYPIKSPAGGGSSYGSGGGSTLGSSKGHQIIVIEQQDKHSSTSTTCEDDSESPDTNYDMNSQMKIANNYDHQQQHQQQQLHQNQQPDWSGQQINQQQSKTLWDMMMNLLMMNKMHGSQTDFNYQNQQTNCPDQEDMVYEMVDHGIKFDPMPQYMVTKAPVIEITRNHIPAPRKSSGKFVYQDKDIMLEQKRKHLEKSFHLKSPKEIFSVIMNNKPSHQEGFEVNSVVANQQQQQQQTDWSKTTQTGEGF